MKWHVWTKATTMASRRMPMKRKSPCAPCDRFLICLRPQNGVPKQRPQDFGRAPNGYEEHRISMGGVLGGISDSFQRTNTEPKSWFQATALHWICKAGLQLLPKMRLPKKNDQHICKLLPLRDKLLKRPTSQTTWNLLHSSTSPFARSLGGPEKRSPWGVRPSLPQEMMWGTFRTKQPNPVGRCLVKNISPGKILP